MVEIDRDRVTLRDIYEIVEKRTEDLEEKFDALINATNHKVDGWRKQFMALIAAIAVVLSPVAIDHWELLGERVARFF